MMQEDDKEKPREGELSPRAGIVPIWRARCITPYNPELLPPEAMPPQEEVMIFSRCMSRVSLIVRHRFIQTRHHLTPARPIPYYYTGELEAELSLYARLKRFNMEKRNTIYIRDLYPVAFSRWEKFPRYVVRVIGSGNDSSGKMNINRAFRTNGERESIRSLFPARRQTAGFRNH